MGAVEASVLILIAVIGAAATYVSTKRSNKKVREENSEQHAAGQDLLRHLSAQVNGIDGKIDGLHEWQIHHIEEHHAPPPPPLKAVDSQG